MSGVIYNTGAATCVSVSGRISSRWRHNPSPPCGDIFKHSPLRQPSNPILTFPFVCIFRDMLITDLTATLTFVELCEEVRTMCSVTKQQPITLKWIDDEGGYSYSEVLSSVVCAVVF